MENSDDDYVGNDSDCDNIWRTVMMTMLLMTVMVIINCGQ